MSLNRCVLLFVVCVTCRETTLAQEPFRHVLTSTNSGTTETSWEINRQTVTPDCEHDWSIRKRTLRGGRQEGVEIVTVDNGAMQIKICPTRGMGIMSVTMDDVELRWDSPVKEIVHPQFVNLESRGGLGWLFGFNEFMCRCGLESNGGPTTDRFINNVGDEASMDLTLHGRIANIPARDVVVRVDRQSPFAIHIEGQVDETLLFGPKLELHSELGVVPGAASFQLVDVVHNAGAQDQEFEILYHANYGSPLLERGAKVVVASESVEPINDRAAEGLTDWNSYAEPVAGFIEQVYLITPKSDADGRTTAVLHNSAADRAASITWSVSELPYLTVWKNTGAIADGYVTGIEPGTNFPHPKPVEREAGRVPVLPPGGSHRMTLEFGIHPNRESVSRVIDRVGRIQRRN